MRFQSGKKRPSHLSILILTTTFLQSNASAVNLLKRVKSVEKSISDDSFELNNCVNDIVRRKAVEPNNIVMISGKRPYWIPTIFLNSSVYNIKTPIANIPASFKYELYIMVMLDVSNIQDNIRVLEYLKKLHPRAFCLIHLNNNGRDAALSVNLKTISHYLTSIGRTAIIMTMHYNRVTDKSLRLYGYSNYTEANCGKVSLVDYGDCSKEETLGRIFSRIMNTNQCPLRIKLVSVLHNTEIYEKNGKMKIRGYEWDLLQFILENINATPYVIPESFNDTGGSRKTRFFVANGKVDVGCGMLLQYNMEKIVYTMSHEILETYIIMPKQDLQPLWMNMLAPFELVIWLLLFMTMTAVIIITWMVSPMRRKFFLWIIIAIPLGGGDPKAMNSTSSKMYFLVLALCGYILSQCYLANLTGIITKPRLSSEMQTLQELEESDYPIYGVNTIRFQLMETNPKLYKRFKEVSVNEFFEMLKQVMEGRKKVAIHATTTQIKFKNTSYSDIRFHMIPEKIGFYPIAMLLSETSVLLTSFDRLISIAVENGLLEYWKMALLKEERERALISGQLDNEIASNGETWTFKGITLTHLQGVFFLLVIGLSVSSLVFIAELIVGLKSYRPISAT